MEEAYLQKQTKFLTARPPPLAVKAMEVVAIKHEF